MNLFAGFVGTSLLDGYEMTPLLTDEEIFELLKTECDPDKCYPVYVRANGTKEIGVFYEEEFIRYVRAIEQAVMKRAYQRAAEMCGSTSACRHDGLDTDWEAGQDFGRETCALAILKLMEEL